MTSEERARLFLEFKQQYMAPLKMADLVKMLDEHAAEARAEQAEKCADAARSEVMDWEGVSVSEGMANAVAKMVSNARVEKNEGKFSNISNYPSGMNYIP